MSIFVHLEGFRHGSLSTFYGCHIGVRFSNLEHPNEDLGFVGPVKALLQLRGMLVILLIQSKQVHGQVHHS
jgi:hypothetical protein